MTDPVADAARATAAILAPSLGPGRPAEVEAALHARDNGEQAPGQYDPLAIAGLAVGAASMIVSIAQLAWSIISDQRTHTAGPSPDSIARQVRIALRQQDRPLPPDTDRIIEVVITEIIRLETRLGSQPRNSCLCEVRPCRCAPLQRHKVARTCQVTPRFSQVLGQRRWSDAQPGIYAASGHIG